MFAAGLFAGVLADLPPVPSRTVIYKSAHATTTNETTTTYTNVDIGVAHPKRIVVVCVFIGTVAGAITSTVNGINHYYRAQNTAHEFGILAHQVPCGDRADVAVTMVGSTRKAAAIYVLYPQNHQALEHNAVTASGTTDAVISDLKVQAGGTLIYCGGQAGTAGAYGTTWSGPDAVVEDVDGTVEATSSYTMGHMDITVSSDLDDLTMAETVSGTKRLVAASWGP